jgi:hypothetical protein
MNIFQLIKYTFISLFNRDESDKLGGVPRSNQWPGVRKEYLKKHPKCFVCLGEKEITVHHKKPFNIHPELELDPTNFITLCEEKRGGLNCHLFIGHLGNFQGFNPDVEVDAEVWRGKILANKTRIKYNK